MFAGNTGAKWKKVIFPANLVKKKAVWSFKGFYTGRSIEDIGFTAEARRVWRGDVQKNHGELLVSEVIARSGTRQRKKWEKVEYGGWLTVR
jgi:hypothetical protein